jgi:arginyl-tRNA synthetase
MSVLDNAKQHIFQSITAIVGNDSLINDIVIDYPPDPGWGDLTVACFVLAKINKVAPAQLAKDLAASIKPDDIIDRVQVQGPYLNFWLKPAYLAQTIAAALAKDYGYSREKLNERVMIEYSNVNTHKEYHIGHLRNVCYGDAVAGILAANGYQVDKVSYVNDFGIHVAKTLWQFKKSEAAVGGGYVLGQMYTAASQALATDEAGKQEVAAIMKQIEGRSGEDYKLWQKTRRWSIDYFASIYERLKINFDQIYYESEVIDDGRELVSKLLERSVLKESEGAVIADLSDYNLGVLVFLRSDGTALYPVADLALAAKKFSKTNLAQSLYVVDNRQTLYFQQLFKILALAGYEAKMVHLAYDFVRLPEGMMSSRSGRVVTFEEVYEETKTKLTAEVAKRHSAWSERQAASVVEALTIGVLKFEMIKVGADKIITFDLNEALRFDGFTAVYLQYTAARINSLLRKGKAKLGGKLPWEKLTETKEKELILAVAKLPETVKDAASRYEPSVLAKYLFDLARLFNDYYQSVPVIQADKDKQAARLALAAAVKQTIANGLALLGIEAVEEM